MQRHLHTVAEHCPDANVLLAGYSQGAKTVDDFMREYKLSQGGDHALIKGVLLLGRPFRRNKDKQVTDEDGMKLLMLCREKDNLCHRGSRWLSRLPGMTRMRLPSAEHFKYDKNASEGARFANEVFGEPTSEEYARGRDIKLEEHRVTVKPKKGVTLPLRQFLHRHVPSTRLLTPNRFYKEEEGERKKVEEVGEVVKVESEVDEKSEKSIIE